MKRFLAACQHYGSERLAATRTVVLGQRAGVAGLPETNDWTAWDSDEM